MEIGRRHPPHIPLIEGPQPGGHRAGYGLHQRPPVKHLISCARRGGRLVIGGRDDSFACLCGPGGLASERIGAMGRLLESNGVARLGPARRAADLAAKFLGSTGAVRRALRRQMGVCAAKPRSRRPSRQCRRLAVPRRDRGPAMVNHGRATALDAVKAMEGDAPSAPSNPTTG